jgi:phosphoglucosamine mutase
MAILSLAMRERGELAHDTLVATVMSNLGMLQALEREGVAVRQTAVGDRYVLEEMKAGAFSLGGEQSGHVIFLDHGTTGDGTMTGLMLASRLAQTGRSLENLAGVMKRLPQVLINVKGVDKRAVEGNEAVQSEVRAAEIELAGVGRVLLRKSGTEPLVRVMVEADDAVRAHVVAQRLADVVARNLAL